MDYIHEESWEKIQDAKNKTISIAAGDPQAQKLFPAYPKCSNFQIHANDNNKPAIMLQDTDIPQNVRDKVKSSNSSKSSTDFGRTNLVEMDLPTIGLPVASKPYTFPPKYKLFIDDEIKLLEDAGCISKSLSDWASPFV